MPAGCWQHPYGGKSYVAAHVQGCSPIMCCCSGMLAQFRRVLLHSLPGAAGPRLQAATYNCCLSCTAHAQLHMQTIAADADAVALTAASQHLQADMLPSQCMPAASLCCSSAGSSSTNCVDDLCLPHLRRGSTARVGAAAVLEGRVEHQEGPTSHPGQHNQAAAATDTATGHKHRDVSAGLGVEA
jgi:hypothetical protein